MATILTEEAAAAYKNDSPNPYLATSPAWYGHAAGRILRARGYCQPIKATMGRGYTVNVWTAANKFTLRFGADNSVSLHRE